MQEKQLKLAIAAIGVVAAAQAAAAPISVSQTVTLNNLMNSNTAVLGFDLNPFLVSNGVSADRVIGGSVVVHGFSEASYGAPQATPYSGYLNEGSSNRTVYGSYYSPGYSSCSWWGGCYYSPGYTSYFSYAVTDSTMVRYRDIAHIDNVADTMTVSVGGASDTAVASEHSASANGYGNYQYVTNVCNYDYYGNCGNQTYYSRERDTYEAVFGALDATVLFDAAGLSDLTADGLVNVTMQALGQFHLDSITFQLDVADQVAPNAVPEPVSGLLLAGGAAALALARRRRKK